MSGKVCANCGEIMLEAQEIALRGAQWWKASKQPGGVQSQGRITPSFLHPALHLG